LEKKLYRMSTLDGRWGKVQKGEGFGRGNRELGMFHENPGGAVGKKCRQNKVSREKKRGGTV